MIEIAGDMVVEKRLFGLAGKRVFPLKTLKAIDSRPKYSNKLPKFALVFEEGSLGIYEFQEGFNDAKKFFEEKYPLLWVQKIS